MQSIPKISLERANFSVRLKDMLESVHGLRPSPTIVAREFNFRFVGKPITVHAARKWLVGEAIPTQDKLRSLAEWLGVSVDWLRFGGTSSQAPSINRTQMPANASPQENLIRMFLALPHRERLLAQAFIEMLGNKVRPVRASEILGPEQIDHS